MTAVVDETPRVRTLVLEVPATGRATAPASTSTSGSPPRTATAPSARYSIASAPGEPLAITVERLEDGEVSPYLSRTCARATRSSVRGPIGGYFVWDPADGGPLLLVAGGSGVVPMRAMLRHRRSSVQRRSERACSTPPARSRTSSTATELDGADRARGRPHADARAAARVDGPRAPRRRGAPARGRLAGRATRRSRSSAARRASSRRSRAASSSSATTRPRIKTERFGATGGR